MHALTLNDQLDDLVAKSLLDVPDDELEAHRQDSARFVKLCEAEQIRRRGFHVHAAEDES